MRQKLTLAIALFTFAAIAVLGAGLAGATTNYNDPATGPAVPAPPPPAPAPPAGDPVDAVTEPEPTPAPAPQPTPDVPERPTINDAIEGKPRGGGNKQSGSTKGRGSKKADADRKKRKKTGGKDSDELEDEEEEEEDLEEIDIFGPAPIAIPNLVLDSFEIPPFLLPIYQACGTQYAIPWQLLAAINKIETAFGTNLSVSYAGAMGWMQFMPGTWEMYGTDGNGDGRKDPYNPVDAICAAARYLRAAGGTERLRDAIFAYNRANWYVEDVLELTRAYSQIPEHLISSLSGLTEGAHFPVAANARYADQITVKEAIRKAETRQPGFSGNAAEVLSSSPGRRSVTIFARPSAPVVAVNDGVIKAIGQSDRLGRFVILEDAYGNRFTYAGLGELMNIHPVPRRQRLTAEDFEIKGPEGDKMPIKPASRTDAPAESVHPESIDATPLGQGQGAKAGSPESRRTARIAARIARKSALNADQHSHAKGHHGDDGHGHDEDGHSEQGGGERGGNDAAPKQLEPINTENARSRVYARPNRPNNIERASIAGQLDHPIAGDENFETFTASPGTVVQLDSERFELKPLKKGSQVIAGTLLGRASNGDETGAGTVQFSIRPPGKDAPQIDPKPILDGWRLLEATAIYRAKRKNPFFTGTGVGQVLMLPKTALIRRVLNDPRLEIYSCGRDDIANGMIDRRVLAVLSYLAERGFRLTVTSLLCGRSGVYTASGNVSNHVGGRAVDIAALNGQPIIGNQGPGSLTEAVVKAVMRLQGTMLPSELISLHDMGRPSFAMGDHHDHIHIGYRAANESSSALSQAPEQILEPGQWTRLMEQLGRIESPVVPLKPSAVATPAEEDE